MMKNQSKNPGTGTYALRLGLIVAAVAAIVGFAAYQTDALSFVPGLGRPNYAPSATKLNVPMLPGAKLLRSYEATFNGLKSKFAHFSSDLSPRQVIAHYKAKSAMPGRQASIALPGVVSAGRGQAMVSYRDIDGSTVGVVAFANPGGGSTYFVGRSKPGPEPIKGRDVPGREPPGVPKPYRSTRVLCLENLAGLPSILSMYDGWGAIDDSVEMIRDEMERAGWKCNENVETSLNEVMDGSVLSYTRGVATCLIHFDIEKRTNHVATMMFYTEKPWLPPGRGF